MEQFKLELRRALEFVRQSEHLVQSHTRPEDPVLFLPDDAALYFLADRLNPTRFDLFFTMVVDKYRKEAWEAIKRTQPLVVLETSGFRFYRDELQLGQLLEFLKGRYALDQQIDNFLVLRYEGPTRSRLRSIPSSQWTATASVMGEHAAKAIDRDRSTRWISRGGQQPGMWFQVDLGWPHAIRRLSHVTGSWRYRGRSAWRFLRTASAGRRSRLLKSGGGIGWGCSGAQS